VISNLARSMQLSGVPQGSALTAQKGVSGNVENPFSWETSLFVPSRKNAASTIKIAPGAAKMKRLVIEPFFCDNEGEWSSPASNLNVIGPTENAIRFPDTPPATMFFPVISGFVSRGRSSTRTVQASSSTHATQSSRGMA
jgi:hypothetical protein